MTVVVDADVLIGALDGSDAHHAAARKLFTGWSARGETVSVSVVNLAEVLVAPAADPAGLRRARAAVAALEVAVDEPGEAIGAEAARLRRVHPVSLADAFCLATARSRRALVASFDGKVLRAAADEGIAVVG